MTWAISMNPDFQLDYQAIPCCPVRFKPYTIKHSYKLCTLSRRVIITDSHNITVINAFHFPRNLPLPT